MEFFNAHKSSQQSHMGEEKHQMLNLNRRLETYLSRVKHLEEENATLAKEIQVLRHSKHGALSRRRGLEEELRCGRLEVEAAWRDRVYMEMEVGQLVEELHALDLLRQKEAQAHVEAQTRLERSRKELQEEQRAQIWLREKVNQLENELTHLIRTHEEDVSHLEAQLTSRSTALPSFAQTRHQNPDLLDLGQEFSQRATRAWQEAAEAYQGQLAQLEESLNQTRSRLNQVSQEKKESQLKLQALEKEIISAQEVGIHLEKTADQQGQRFSQEVQELQEHLESLEVEKEELGQQIERILLENRGLLQAKMSLGMEVATYRALLDGENLKGNVSHRNTFITDAAFSSHGVKKNYQTQLPTSRKTTSFSSVRGVTGTRQTTRTTTPVWSKKSVTVTETPKTYAKPVASEPPYPKIIQDGAVENFRPQEVQETVTYAEPLSPPNEEALIGSSKDGEGEVERLFTESVIQHTVESILCREPLSNDDTPNPDKEELWGFSDEPNMVAEERDQKVPCSPVVAWEDKKDTDRDLKHLQEETDSETEALLEPTFESRTSSPVSECEPEEDEETILKEAAAATRQEVSASTGVEEKLYPDGEEMDTWDSVIERKVELKDDNVRAPEEDISGREQGHVTREQHDLMTVGQTLAFDLEHTPLSDKEEDEDSQNVSVSWRTEVEGDSYAQDNTLADTRPLIRYKSDETDANTHASHMDESESSEGEQEKKVGETGSGTWDEAKSKRFGTMEDLCEEVEGEVLDEVYDVGFTQKTNQGTGLEFPEREEGLKEVGKGHWEETEELTEPMEDRNVSYDEELEIDRLVEQELENLATDSYSAHFAQQQISKSEDVVPLRSESIKDQSTGSELTSFGFGDPSVEKPQGGTSETVQHQDQEGTTREEEEIVSSVTCKDPTVFGELLSKLDKEEAKSVDVAKDASLEASQEHLTKEFPEVAETTQWDVLDSPGETKHQESAESFLGFVEEGKAPQAEPLETSPDIDPDQKDIFWTKDSAEPPNTNGKDKDLHAFFSSGVQSDFWMSSLETGATFQPDDAFNEAAEQTNKNQGYADRSLWGDLDDPKVDIDSAEAERKKMFPEMKQTCRNVEGEFVHSEESDVEGEPWSSGEEAE
ncbi:nestin [Halichoeres trimaculatus]|uniref:nestin n=1 Tax=Halichoeres trimaculatus TaxID=147232 RepID=UPI003D9F9CCD